MNIRDAGPDDMPAVTAIYNEAVETTTAIWNDTPVDTANRIEWLAARRKSGYPVLVAVDDDAGVVGYARSATGARSTATGTPWSTPCMSARTSAAKASPKRS